jgi:hypothetical protein
LMTGFCSMEIYAYYKFTQEIQTEVWCKITIYCTYKTDIVNEYACICCKECARGFMAS